MAHARGGRGIGSHWWGRWRWLWLLGVDPSLFLLTNLFRRFAGLTNLLHRIRDGAKRHPILPKASLGYEMGEYMALKKFCRKQGCQNLTDQGYCEQHKAESHGRYDKHRGSAAERGYDAKWRKARLRYLKQHPLCKHCQDEGRTVAASVVDHVIPHKGNKGLFWSEYNWQPLCKRHHDIKTVTEDGGFGNG